MENQQKIYSQHSENAVWLKELAFYADECKIMNNRIAEVAAKNTSKDVLAKVEHFQNQLIVQKNNIDEIKHLINIHEDKINSNINKNPVSADHRSMEDHSKERGLVKGFEKNFNALRHELNAFLASVL